MTTLNNTSVIAKALVLCFAIQKLHLNFPSSYTKDEAMLFGISRDTDISGHLDTSNEDECLKLVKEYFQTDIG